MRVSLFGLEEGNRSEIEQALLLTERGRLQLSKQQSSQQSCLHWGFRTAVTLWNFLEERRIVRNSRIQRVIAILDLKVEISNYVDTREFTKTTTTATAEIATAARKKQGFWLLCFLK